MHSLLYHGLISHLPDKWVEALGGPYFKFFSHISFTPMVDMPIEIADITFPNPVGMPAGWIDTPSKLQTIHRLGAGIPTIKTITCKPKEGNPYPRIIRDGDMMINSLGLPNRGVDWWKENFEKPEYPIIISIKGETFNQWVELIEKLEDKASLLELNLSCPNVGQGILDLSASEELVKDIANISDTKMLLKLSPEFSPEQNTKLIEKIHEQIAGVTAINTMPVQNDKLGNPLRTGGMSGRPLYEIMISQLKAIREQFPLMNDLPILATGGIFTSEQAWEVLSEYRSLPLGLTGFLMRGPRYYYKLSKHIKKRIDDGLTLNEIIN